MYKAWVGPESLWPMIEIWRGPCGSYRSSLDYLVVPSVGLERDRRCVAAGRAKAKCGGLCARTRLWTLWYGLPIAEPPWWLPPESLQLFSYLSGRPAKLGNRSGGRTCERSTLRKATRKLRHPPPPAATTWTVKIHIASSFIWNVNSLLPIGYMHRTFSFVYYSPFWPGSYQYYKVFGF